MTDIQIILVIIFFFIYIFYLIGKRSYTKTEVKKDVPKNSQQEKVIRPKVEFDGSFSIFGYKMIPEEIGIFLYESQITDFIRSIPLTALDLHPIFDHELIEKGGAYKYWDIPSQMLKIFGLLQNSDYSDIQIRIEITCSDKKGTIHFNFPRGKSIYSSFNFEGEKTVLNAIYYMSDYFGRIIEFSKGDLFTQKDQPVFINLTVPEVRSYFGYPILKNETPYYDYFLFKDRLFKIDKELGDLEKKAEIIKEFYERKKQTGHFDLEERVEQKADYDYNETKERQKIPESVRSEVWRRDGGKCSNCGSRDKLEYHHIIPFSKGGSNTARNIELLCMECNRMKSDKI